MSAPAPRAGFKWVRHAPERRLAGRPSQAGCCSSCCCCCIHTLATVACSRVISSEISTRYPDADGLAARRADRGFWTILGVVCCLITLLHEGNPLWLLIDFPVLQLFAAALAAWWVCLTYRTGRSVAYDVLMRHARGPMVLIALPLIGFLGPAGLLAGVGVIALAILTRRSASR